MFLISQKISADHKGPKLKYKLCYGQSKIAKLCFLPLVMCCLLLWQLGQLFLKSFLFQSCNIRVAHEFDATD